MHWQAHLTLKGLKMRMRMRMRMKTKMKTRVVRGHLPC